MYQLFERLITCSIIITTMTPIAKPLPTNGWITAGATPLGISWKSKATMMGRPRVRASANVVAERDDCIISKDAASCVPIKNSNITPITGEGIAVSTQMTSGKRAHATNNSVAGMRA